MNSVTEIIVNIDKEETNVYFYNTPIEEENEEIKNEKIDIKVTKDWEGTKEESIKVNLLANGKIIDTVNIVNNDWTFTFEDLDVLDENNNVIKYTVEEVRDDGQVIKVYGNAIDGFIITSTIIIPDTNKIDIDVKKIWDGKKQSRAVINLMIGHEKIDSIVLNSKNNWQYTFENLNYNDENDLKINYSVTEDEIEGYEVEITGNSEKGFVITNVENKPIYTEKRDIYVKKVWDGEKQKRTEVDLILNNKVIDSVILNESNRWQHTFEDLDATDEEGIELEYTIGEEKIRGYSVKVTGNMNRGFTITNTEEGRESKRDISIEKYWIGESLDEVTIKLFANGKETEKVKLNNRNKFKYVFEDMPVFKYVKAKDRNGVSYEIEEEIEYTIGELKIDGYKVDIKGDMKKGFEITNTQIEKPNPIKTINIPVNMSWIGSSAAKTAIAIKLFGDTDSVDSVILSDFNNWSHVFRDMPAVNSETGKDIIYYLSDVVVEGYNVNIEGSMSTGYTIVATPSHYKPDVLSYDYVHHNANDTGGDIVIDDNNIDSRSSLEKNNDYVEDVKTNDPGITHAIILSILTGALFIIINKKRKLNKFK
ncbi:MAG TPA: Cna B-type domain-containing protein [Clostridiales bacterium]|nr:Cna B-type domain-containing protein [Clostridiales bacterium]